MRPLSREGHGGRAGPGRAGPGTEAREWLGLRGAWAPSTLPSSGPAAAGEFPSRREPGYLVESREVGADRRGARPGKENAKKAPFAQGSLLISCSCGTFLFAEGVTTLLPHFGGHFHSFRVVSV